MQKNYIKKGGRKTIMNLFSDIYNCYYQVMKKILIQQCTFSKKDLDDCIKENGFEESPLFIMPKILSGEWDFFEENNGIFISKLSGGFSMPLSKLQKCYISALLLDEKIQLFFNKKQLDFLKKLFAGYKPLWTPEDFYYYDRFTDKDDFSSPAYINIFQTILSAIKNCQWVSINYKGKNSTNIHELFPCRLEYSLKNDCFRLIASPCPGNPVPRIELYNLSNIIEISLIGKYETGQPDINKAIRESYYKEPVRLLIKDERNALERTMLQFANYEKNTTKINNDTYECCIYYNKNVETELLIEILSFGPVLQVTGNEYFLGQLKQRLKKQAGLMVNL